ncbi:hypothetical protein GRX03_03545 [Halovenus sp. WSH3]|uniref:Uncharacterized protein n=1 Tax=Halovenus carboxidivorans TaxID=2692199 RepID=A0A6B0T5T1_9EURY|nr:hypothetical protein [Halovenus carboxidivorans]MXR50682.1 hypothetical protein [Halovenus carboxidivorans]
MSDPSDRSRDESETEPVHLVPDGELERLRADRDRLSATVNALEAENRMLKLEIAALERRLEQKERNRQQIVENYERILARRAADSEADRAETAEDRFRLGSLLFGRSDEN